MSARERLKDAIQKARKRRASSLPALFGRDGHEINDERQAACCFCESGKLTFVQDPADETWTAACSNESCRASSWFDEVTYLALSRNLSEDKAVRKLLDDAGLSKLWKEAERSAQEKTDTKESTAGDTPQFIRIPEVGQNVYETAWTLLRLTDEHREELHSKRGMPDPWIRSFGIRSAIPENRDRLAPLLEKFPPNQLLRSGLASRGRDGELRISDAICGRVFDKDENQWITRETTIIPYITEDGRIELLRPHKMSLSNARWREQEVASNFYEKLHHSLRIPYGKHLLGLDRHESWRHSAVIGEGEYKGMALAMAGIPSLSFQGIHFFLQNKHHRQAIQDTVTILREAGIRLTITVFDSEDKSHKPFHKQFETETFARYTTECLEDAGFTSYYGNLPIEWREGGEKHKGKTIKAKADWDSRLAYHVRQAGGDHTKGIQAAAKEFSAFLNYRRGQNAPIRPSPRQIDFIPDPKEDIIQQALHRYRHVPEMHEGTQREIEIAAEIENFTPPEYADTLKVRKVAQDLRNSVGGYYVHKTPSEALEKRTIDTLRKVQKELEELENEPNPDEERIRALRAAKETCYIILYRYPKSFTDFTAISKYKILAYNEKGEARLDRLVTFIDKTGRRKGPFQMPADRMGSSQEMRKFFISMGGFHWSGNQAECDLWVKELDIQNYQKDIEAIDTYGWQEKQEIYLFRDCAIADGTPNEPGKFLFPDRNGIIWHRGRGYKNSEEMASFSHTPPGLFPHEEKPADAFNQIDWNKEKKEVRAIWNNAVRDFKESLGGYAGYAMIGAILQYLAHPETLPTYGKKSLSIQGEKGSGKTKTTAFAMGLLGYDSYQPISLGSTKVGIERALTRFRGLPLHIDEWRNDKVNSSMLDLFIAAHNELAQHKGTPQGGKTTRSMSPLTPAIITGEDSTTDPALRSRYVRIVASPSYGRSIHDDEDEVERESRELQEKKARDERFERMLQESPEYYRIGRVVIRERKRFAKLVMDFVKEFTSKDAVIQRIGDSRARQNVAIFIGAVFAAMEIIFERTNSEIISSHPEEKAERTNMIQWFLAHAEETNQEIENDIFRVRFFADSVTMIERGHVQGADKYIRVIRGAIGHDNQISPINDYNTTEGRLLVVIRPAELFQEYQRDQRQVEGRGSPISRPNILAELRLQPYWIPAPKRKPRQHRFKLPRDGSRSGLWVLDWKTMDPDLRDVFRRIYEKELEANDMELDDDGETIKGMHQTPIGI